MERNHRLVAGMAVISTGVLLLLGNLHLVTNDDLRRYWPVLLILTGFGKLFLDRGRSRSRLAGSRPFVADSCENLQK